MAKNAQHSYDECHANPCNQKISSKACTNNNNKCRHDSHYQDNCYTSSNDELHRSNNTPMPSEGEASASSASKEEEDYHLDYDGKIPQKQRKVDVPSCSQKNKKNLDIDLGWDDVPEDAYLNDVMKNKIGTLDENPLDFDN
jgi:hypothetical protein